MDRAQIIAALRAVDVPVSVRQQLRYGELADAIMAAVARQGTSSDLPPALPYEVHGTGKAAQYGNFFWTAGLADGREARIHADEMTVRDGSLIFTRTSRPDQPPLTTLALAPGQWTHGAAASMIDGAPVAVDSLDAPTAQQRKADAA